MIKERFKVSCPPPTYSLAPPPAAKTASPRGCFYVPVCDRASMTAWKSCARSRRPGLSPTRSRGTESARLRRTSSRRPMGPSCTGVTTWGGMWSQNLLHGVILMG